MAKDLTQMITLTVQDFAEKKECTRKTVYNNLDQLNIYRSGKIMRIIWDNKSIKWKPKEKMARHKAAKKKEE